MKRPPVPPTETQRLLALRGLDIMDTVPEERFDRVTRLARRLFGVPIALLSLVDVDRQWFKSRQGLDAGQTSREISFCGHAVAADEPFVVNDAADDERFHDNPLVQDDPAIRFYAGYPVHTDDGSAVGTLCIIDRQPRSLSEEDLGLLRDLAKMIEDELYAVRNATTDALTGLSNRRGFDLLARTSLAVSARTGAPSTLVAFDLDGFKPINDRLGHAVGDRALVDFATALLKTFREADAIARLGGDEFCVLASGPAAAMSAPLARLEQALGALLDRPYQLAFSAGAVEHAAARHGSIADLLADADRVLYEDKQRRRPTTAG